MSVVTATGGVDIDLVGKDVKPELKWQLDAPVGKVADLRVTPGGFSVRWGDSLVYTLLSCPSRVGAAAKYTTVALSATVLDVRHIANFRPCGFSH